MVRQRMLFVAELGKFRQAMTWVEELNGARRKIGLPDLTAWTPLQGEFNSLILEADYPDLAAYESANAKFHTDPQTMMVFRKGNEWGSHDHWPKDEIIVSATQIA